jgi:hypothetical protein
MGDDKYSFSARSARTATYATKSINQTFEQQAYRRIHESMEPKNIKIRECRDSETHPNTVPIVLGMDVTGSMGIIPHELVKTGLPKLMSNVIERGVPDASLLFIAVGDHIRDSYPVQVGQFESGDSELDMWLTRTYLEGGGGGNGGESYSLVWDFANRFIVTDAWEKRKQKGFMITFGDEPFHDGIPASFINSVYNEAHAESTLSNVSILSELNEKWNYIHIHIDHGGASHNAIPKLKELLGENLIVITDYKVIPDVISDFVLRGASVSADFVTPSKPDVTNVAPNIIL